MGVQPSYFYFVHGASYILRIAPGDVRTHQIPGNIQPVYNSETGQQLIVLSNCCRHFVVCVLQYFPRTSTNGTQRYPVSSTPRSVPVHTRTGTSSTSLMVTNDEYTYSTTIYYIGRQQK